MTMKQTNADGIQRTALTPDQDPIYDHVNGKVTSVTTSAVILTPPAGCTFAEIIAPADIWVRTDNVAATVPVGGDTVAAVLVSAGTSKIIPVVSGTPVRAISASGSAVVVVAVPLKVRT